MLWILIEILSRDYVKGGKGRNDFKFGTFVGRFSSDGAANLAVKGLKVEWGWCACRSPLIPGLPAGSKPRSLQDTIDPPKEIWVYKEEVLHNPPLKGRERSLVNLTNIGIALKATLGNFVKVGAKRI